MIMTLKDAPNGKTVWVKSVICGGREAQRLFAMGIVGGTPIKKVKQAPVGGGVEITVFGYELALCKSIAEKIFVVENEPELLYDFDYKTVSNAGNSAKKRKKPEKLVFALVGNQNCGKSTLFNSITGGNQHTGNFSGVTVEMKAGNINGRNNILAVDLPGTYSLLPYSGEEKTVNDFLKRERPDCIINVIDATNIERNLYLTTELTQLGIPMIIALNMMDEVKDSGAEIRVAEIEKQFGVKAVPISASKNKGIEELINYAVYAARRRCIPNKIEFFKKEGEELARARYMLINKLCRRAVCRPNENKHSRISRKTDILLTGKYTAIPMFAVIMLLVFHLAFNLIGGTVNVFLELGFEWVELCVKKLFVYMNVSHVISALVIDGIFYGVGSVLSFLPYILTLFFLLSLLEDSGYMSRIAFVADGILRKIGLSGKSIVPMLMGFGCTVPAVMASRTVADRRDKTLAIIATPFMSCTAKLPIYVFFAKRFFPHQSVQVIFSLYLIGAILGIIYAHIIGKTILYGKTEPLIMELPNYRMPTVKTTFRLLKYKVKDFSERVFTVILISSVAIWVMQYFDVTLKAAASPDKSVLANIANVIVPIFKPLGFGDWRAAVAVVSGVLAKENIVSSISVLCADTAVFDKASALSFMVFCLLYTPCVATVSTVSREIGGKWAAAMAVCRFAMAWLIAFLVNITMQKIFI